jgi:predicted membrane protein
MSLITVVLTLIVVGLVLYLINRFIPMQGTVKSILNIVVIVAVIIWLLYGFGVIGGSGDINMPRLD